MTAGAPASGPGVWLKSALTRTRIATAGHVTQVFVALARDADLLETREEPVPLREHQLALLGVSRVAHAGEHPLHLAGAIVDRPAETDRRLTVGLEVRQHARRRDAREVHHEVRPVLLDRYRDGSRAVWLQRRVPGPEMYPHALLEEGRQLPVNHRKIRSISAFRDFLRFVQILLRML